MNTRVGGIIVAVVVGCGGNVGSGGSGGSSGAGGAGAAGGAGGSSIEELIDEYCARTAALGCFETPPDCRVSGRNALAEAVRDGCTAEFSTALRCATSAEVSCARPVNIVCADPIDRLEACSGSGACEVGGGSGGAGPTTCYVDCGDYSVECMQAGDIAECTCTSGSAAGQRYASSTCDSGLDAAESICL